MERWCLRVSKETVSEVEEGEREVVEERENVVVVVVEERE